MNYEVQSLRDANVKKVVHVSRMRKFHPWERISKSDPAHVDITSPLPGYDQGNSAPQKLFPCEDFEIGKGVYQYIEGDKSWFLIEWIGYSQPSWEAEANINAKALLTEWKRKVRAMPIGQRRDLKVHPSKRVHSESNEPVTVDGLPYSTTNDPATGEIVHTPAEEISSKRKRRRRRS